MKYILLSVGKKHDPLFSDIIDDYTARCNRTIPTQWLLLASKQTGSIEQIKAVEADLLLAHLPDSAIVVLLDEIGTQLRSEDVSKMLEDWSLESRKEIYFVIGGAFGVEERVRARADFVWSLGKLTFPHQLVRVILAEQLYRAISIQHGSSYHHR